MKFTSFKDGLVERNQVLSSYLQPYCRVAVLLPRSSSILPAHSLWAYGMCFLSSSLTHGIMAMNWVTPLLGNWKQKEGQLLAFFFQWTLWALALHHLESTLFPLNIMWVLTMLFNESMIECIENHLRSKVLVFVQLHALYRPYTLLKIPVDASSLQNQIFLYPMHTQCYLIFTTVTYLH